jgi:hypothetical protein
MLCVVFCIWWWAEVKNIYMHVDSLSFLPLSNIEALHFVIMNDFNELMQIETKIRKKKEKGGWVRNC